MRSCYILLMMCCLGIAACLLTGARAETAYQEDIISPQWPWVQTHAAGSVHALVLINERAVREADEIAQRFHFTCTTIAITGQDTQRSCNHAALIDKLTNSTFDVIVLASEGAWIALSDEVKSLLATTVEAGTPLVVYDQLAYDGWLNTALAKPASIGNGFITGGNITAGVTSARAELGTAFSNFANGSPKVISTNSSIGTLVSGHRVDYSIDAWVKWDGTGTGRLDIVQMQPKIGGANAGYRWDFAINATAANTGTLSLQHSVGSGNPGRVISSASLTWDPSTWYHVAVTVDYISDTSCTFRFYRTPAPANDPPTLVSTVAMNSMITNGGVANTRCEFTIGNGLGVFPGSIDQVRISNTVRTTFPLTDVDANTLVLLPMNETSGEESGIVANTNSDTWNAAINGVLDIPPDATRGVPVYDLTYKNNFACTGVTAGAGQIYRVSGYDRHWTYFNSFVTENLPFFDDPNQVELMYALTGRMLRWIGAKDGIAVAHGVKPSGAATVGTALSMHVNLHGSAIQANDTVDWALRSPFSEPVATGSVTLTAGQSTATCAVTPPQAGKLVFQYLLQRGATTLDMGATYLQVSTPLAFSTLTIPESVAEEGNVSTSWTLTAAAQAEDTVLFQVYDADDRLVSVTNAPATAGAATIPGWIPTQVTYRVRAFLLRDSQTLDERQLWTQVVWDRTRDIQEFNVMAWGTEDGTAAERKRMRLLRELGITTLGTIGRFTEKNRMASEEGLRVMPINISIPPTQNEAQLESFAATVSKYRPLAYSLCDEPDAKTSTPATYRDWAAGVIHRQDPGAKVGFDGLWDGMDKDVPSLLASCDLAISYSPFYLYTPEIWRGIERDLFRSLRLADSLIGNWTQYYYWGDHEPYARVVPWAWLFEGCNMLAYFDTGGEYAIFPPDMRTTHETRWLSAELHEIRQGAGAQLVGMQRSTGVVRILFQTGAHERAADYWARSMNRLNLPYRFMSKAELANGVEASVRLLICPDVYALTDAELARLQEFVDDGGLLVATAPCGLVNADVFAPADRLQSLFGIVRSGVYPSTTEWTADKSLYGKTSGVVSWSGSGSWQLTPATLSGFTIGGERNNTVVGATTIGAYQSFGPYGPSTPGAPAFLANLFATPAAVQKDHASGKTLYLTFQPDLESLKRLLPVLMNNAGISPVSEWVEIGGQVDDTCYLYPFTNANVRMLGVIRDYVRVKQTQTVRGADKNTALYYEHGPSLWSETPAVVKFSTPYHVYDSRRGLYLGNVSQVTLQVNPGRPDLLALLPYRVTAVGLSGLPASIAQGGRITSTVTLTATGGTPGFHVVHVSVTGPTGKTALADRYNVRTNAGAGTVRVTIPYNAQPGTWTIAARDAVTGVSTQTTFTVTATPVATGPNKLSESSLVMKTALNWPQGVLDPYTTVRSDVGVSVTQPYHLYTTVGAYSGHSGHNHLYSNATMSGNAQSWTWKYKVCHDTAAHGWSDPQQIYAQYRSGLGFYAPEEHMWYYNGYISVYFDAVDITKYAISSVQEVDAGSTNGRVDVTFDSPYGQAILSFGMMVDHRAMLQQLRVIPAIPVTKVSVGFSSYYAGWDNTSYGVIHTDPLMNSWAFMGNSVDDPAFGRGLGGGALLLLPEQLNDWTYGNTCSMSKTVNLQPGQESRIQWALFMFPGVGNSIAEQYLLDNAADNRQRLIDFYGATLSPPPTVSLTATGQSTSTPGVMNIVLDASAEDVEGYVAKVEFYHGSTKLGEDTSSPYSFTWNDVPAGRYTLKAVAIDNEGKTGTATTTLAAWSPLTVDANTVALLHLDETTGTQGTPVEALHDPAFTLMDSSIASSAASVAQPSFASLCTSYGPFTSTSGYPKVDAAIGANADALVGCAQADYTFECYAKWDGTGGTSGQKRILLASGYVMNGETIRTYGWELCLAKTATNTARLRLYGYFRGYSGVQILSSDPLPWDTNTWYHIAFTQKYTNGTGSGAVIRLFRTPADQRGNPANPQCVGAFTFGGISIPNASPCNSKRISIGRGAQWCETPYFPGQIDEVRVSNIVRYFGAPTVSIAAQTVPSSTPGLMNVNLTATAADFNGTVSKVEFYEGTTKLGEDTASPFTCAWNDVAGGSYSFSAVATDNEDYATTSDPVALTVMAPMAVDTNTVALLHLDETTGTLGTAVEALHAAAFTLTDSSVLGGDAPVAQAPPIATFTRSYGPTFSAGYPKVDGAVGASADSLVGDRRDYTFECFMKWNGYLGANGRTHVASAFVMNGDATRTYGWDFQLYKTSANNAGLAISGYFAGYSGVQRLQTDSLAWDPNTWYHVAFTQRHSTTPSSTVFNFYRTPVDQLIPPLVPQLVGSATYGSFYLPNASPYTSKRLCIGGGPNFSTETRTFPGLIDEVRVSNCVRY